MRKLLIAESSGVFGKVLAEVLWDSYETTCCHTGRDALRLLQSLHPDAVVIDLSLPYMDGIQVLNTSEYKAPVVIAMTSLINSCVLQMAKDAGVDFMLVLPCTVRSVVHHLKEVTQQKELPAPGIDPQRITESYLQKLGLAIHQAGYQQLRVGIPIFAQDESQHLKKELYSTIARLCGNDNAIQVERSIRDCIHKAWLRRDAAVWNVYFPGMMKAPSNKVFIAAMAQVLRRSVEIIKG